MSRPVKIAILLLLTLPLSLLAQSNIPRVIFRYEGTDYELPKDEAILPIVYGRDAEGSLPRRIQRALTGDSESFAHFDRLTRENSAPLTIVIEYGMDKTSKKFSKNEIVLPHELSLNEEGLRDGNGLSTFLIGEVAKRSDKAQPEGGSEGSHEQNETVDKDNAFHNGWVLYNQSLIDRERACEVSKSYAKIVKPAFDGSLETVEKPSLEHYLSTEGCVSTILAGLDKNGENRQAIQNAFEQTSLPQRTVDTFLIAYALDNPKDALRAAKVFDIATAFSASPEDIALRFGPSSIGYAFDERTAFKNRCEDCKAMGMDTSEIIAGFDGQPNETSGPQIVAENTSESKAELEETELLGILTK